MRQSWRWFGPQDPITLRDIAQAGATDIVTALHHIRCGDLWTEAEIAKRVQEVAFDPVTNRPTGLRWSVVESVAVHEDIKTQRGPWRERIEVYKQSLTNLAKHGLTTICYNFMPVLDWTRTDLEMELPDGSSVLNCDADAIAAFDLFILKRPGASASYSADEVDRAKTLFARLTDEEKARISNSILMGLPGTVDDLTPAEFLTELERYRGIDANRLRQNLVDFLSEIMPLCDRLGIRMAIHPDDPPRPIFGLPRILSCAEDVVALFAAVPSANCGLTLCTGSFGGRPENNPAAMFEQFAPRIHFAHLRNVTYPATRNEKEVNRRTFHESNHLTGHVDMVRTMTALIREEERRKAAGQADWLIPVRPDHGKLMDIDRAKKCYNGYSFGGRVIGLAELRGLEFGLRSSLGCPVM